MAGAPVGTMFAAMDLDLTKLEQNLKRAYNLTVEGTQKFEAQFNQLGIKSDRMFESQKQMAIASYQAIARSGEATANDRVRAEQAMHNKIKALQQEQLGSHSSFLNTMKENWMVMAGAVYAAVQTIGKAWEYIEEGAKAQQAEESFRRVADASGESADAILEAMKRASAGTVEESDIMQKAVKGMVLGLKGDQLVKIMEEARYAARLTGEDVQTAYEKITDAIATGMPKSLKQYGLITKEEMALVKEAVKAGVEDVDLYSIAAGHMAEQQAKMGELSVTAAEQIQQFHAGVKEAKEQIGIGLINALKDCVDPLKVIAELTGGVLYAALWSVSQAIKIVWTAFEGLAGVALIAAGGLMKGLSIMTEGYAGFLRFIGQDTAADEMTIKAAQFKQTAENLGASALDLGDKIKKQWFEEKEVAKQTTQAEKDTIEAAKKARETGIQKIKDQIKAKKDALEDGKKAEREAAAETKKIEDQNLKEAQKQADELRAIKEISADESVKIRMNEEKRLRKNDEDRLKSIKYMCKETQGYEAENYEFELQALEIQKKEYQRLNIDKNLIDRWYVEQKKKLDQDLILSSDNFFGGISVGMERMKDDMTTWADVGLETFDTFANNAESTVSSVLFDGMTHQLKTFGDYWKSFWTSAYQYFANIVAKMATEQIMLNVGFNSTGAAVSGASGATGAGVGGMFAAGGAYGGEYGTAALIADAIPAAAIAGGVAALTYFTHTAMRNTEGMSGTTKAANVWAATNPITAGPYMALSALGVIGGGGRKAKNYTYGVDYGDETGLTAQFTGGATRALAQSQTQLKAYQDFLIGLPSWVDTKKIFGGITEGLEDQFTAVTVKAKGLGGAIGEFDKGLADTLSKNYKEWSDALEKYYNTIATESGNAISSAVKAGMSNTDPAIDAFTASLETSLYDSISNAMITAFANSNMVQQAIAPFLDTMYQEMAKYNVGGEFNALGFVSSMQAPIAALNSQLPAIKAAYEVLRGAMGDIKIGIMGSEFGNVFNNGMITPFAYGDIFNRPTYFPMARGMGLMGEAGPEAVMPLTRGRDGKLGVKAQGVSNISFHFHGTLIDKKAVNEFAEQIYPRLKQLENWGH